MELDGKAAAVSDYVEHQILKKKKEHHKFLLSESCPVARFTFNQVFFSTRSNMHPRDI